MSDRISSMGLKSRRAKNHSKELREKQFAEIVRTKHTVFDLITAPALITATTPLTFYFIFTYYRTLDDLFLDFLLYFHLLSHTWRSFGTSSREQIYVSAPPIIKNNLIIMDQLSY